MNKQRIAKDPIDFIRNYRFGIFKVNPGSTAGPTRVERNLTIRIADAVHSMVTEVTLAPVQWKTAGVIANWLEKQPLFFVQPYAKIFEQEDSNTTMLMLSVNSFEVRPVVIKDHIDSIIQLMDETRLMMESGNASCMRPSYEPNPDMPNGGGGAPATAAAGQVIGHIVLDDPRTPVANNRFPQGWNNNNNGHLRLKNDW